MFIIYLYEMRFYYFGIEDDGDDKFWIFLEFEFRFEFMLDLCFEFYDKFIWLVLDLPLLLQFVLLLPDYFISFP